MLVLGGCTNESEGVSFNQQVLPVLKRHCVVCHMTSDTQGGLGLYPEHHPSLVSAPSNQSKLMLVEPGSIENSYLYHKLMNTQLSAGGEGASMPYQRDALSPADIETIRLWIQEGAKRN